MYTKIKEKTQSNYSAAFGNMFRRACFGDVFSLGVSKASTWLVRAEAMVGVNIPDIACSRISEYTSFRATPSGTTSKEYLS